VDFCTGHDDPHTCVGSEFFFFFLFLSGFPFPFPFSLFQDWSTLTFQIYLTATAANVAQEWSHDLGAFMSGDASWVTDTSWRHNPEIFARWLQAGVRTWGVGTVGACFLVVMGG
jgi:hypothetical protein